MDEEFDYEDNEATEDGAIISSGEVAFAPDSSVNFTDEDSVEAFLKNKGFSTSGVLFERRKLKDFRQEDQEKLKETFRAENPEFEFVIIKDTEVIDTSSIKLNVIKAELESTYKVATLEYKDREIVSPRMTFDYASIAYPVYPLESERIAKTQNSNIIESLNNFGYLASSLLIEPRIYASTPEETEAEIKEINSLFYNKYKVVPSFYAYLLSLLNNKINQGDEALYKNQYIASGAIVTGSIGIPVLIGLVSNPVGWVVGGGLIAIGLFGAGPNVTGLAETAKEDVILNLKRIQYAGAVPIILEKDKNIFDQILAYNKPEKVDWLRFGQKIGLADKINEAIEVFVKDIYMQSKAFKIFQELANEITTGSTTANLLKKTGIQDLNSDERDKGKLSIFSNQLAGEELNAFLNHVLMFPAAKSWTQFDEENSSDLFSLNDQTKQVSLLYDKESLFYKGGNNKTFLQAEEDYLFNKQVDQATTIQETYFNKNKNRLKEYNKKMVGFLKTLLDSLIEDAGALNFNDIYKVDPELGKALGEQDIFTLMEDNAYPDILLPKDPILARIKDAGARVSPDFYYFKNKQTDLSFEEKTKASFIFNKSKSFKDAMKNGAVTSNENEEPLNYYDPNIFMNLNYYNGDAITDLKPGDVTKSEAQDSAVVEPLVDIRSFRNLTEPSDVEAELSKLKDYYKNEIENKINEFNNFATPSIFGDKFGIVGKTSPVNDEISADSYIYFDTTQGMMGAFPTFRLYLVEEDSIYSDRLLAFDDFFYYNSVISFNVHNSRELAASTATIQLQNISGLLDGTRKSLLRDIDLGGEKYSQGQEDQIPTVESVTLRKGVNVQLRAGYANNTNDLDVLISGRITEISYSGDNMMCSIVVQSYGVELESFKYSQSGSGNNSNSFYTTHQLLGSLLLHPSLKHFGRVKTGKLFQTFESKMPALDFEQYTENTGWSFNWTNSWLDWITDNSLALTGVAVVTSFFTPSLRAIGNALKAIPFVGKGVTFLSNTKFTSLIGRSIAYPFRAVSYVNGLLGKYLGKFATQKLDDSALKVITNLGKARDKQLLNFIKSSTLKDNRSIAQVKIIEALKKAGIVDITSVSATQVRQALNTIIETELGFLARYFGWGASAELAALRLGTLPLARSGGFSGFGKAVFNSLVLFPSKTNLLLFTGLSTVGLAPLFGDLLYNTVVNGFNFIADMFSKSFNEKQRPNITKLLLSPQDDNLYFPNVSTYIKNLPSDRHYSSVYNNIIKTGSKLSYAAYKYANEGIFIGSVGNYFIGWNGSDISSIAEDAYIKARGIVDRRMNAERKENEYVLTSKNLWEVLHEMTLRHPGYIYGVRPYGNSLEYRVFFGQPGQRYFRKDISNYSVFRLNSIYEKISQLQAGSKLSLEDINILFPKESQAWSKTVNNYLTDSKELKINYFTDFALKEWLRKTKDRFVPFRQYHGVNSGRNLIANNVIVSGHNVYNAVSTHYNIVDSDGETASIQATGVWRSTSSSNIPQELLREQTIKEENIKGVASAWNYSCGSLIYGAKNMYEGTLLILGNTKINPWDVLILNDNVNVMYGPLEVKSVTHMFSHDTGFLSDIEVNALVTNVEDETTYPALHQHVFFEARKALYESYNSKAAFTAANPEKEIEKIVNNAVDKFFEGEVGEIDLPGLDPFGSAKTDRDKKTLKDVKEKLKKAFINYYNKNNKFEPFFLNDIVAENALLPEELEAPLKEAGINVALTGGGISALAFGNEILLSKGAGIATRQFRLPGILGAVAAGVGLYTATIGSGNARKILSESFNGGKLGKNMFRPTILSKIDNSGVIEVYPLVKDGRPLLAGGFETAREEEKWNNILGNIYSAVSDGYKGYIENKQLIEAYDKTSPYMTNIPEWIKPVVKDMNGANVTVTNYKLVKGN